MSAYARLQYDASIGVENYADVGARERRAARRTALAPAGIDADNVRDDGVNSLTFLAVEWLVDQAGSDAIAYYHRLLSSSSDSSWAFETAFGMSFGGFHESFEAYRAEHFPPDAHLLADNVPGATFVFLGDVPATTREALEAEHERVRAFVAERFGTGLPGYTVYAGADWAAVREAFPTRSNACGLGLLQSHAIVALDRCGSVPLDEFAFQSLTDRAPAPMWLQVGAERYATTEYRVAAGRVDRDQHHAYLIALAKYDEGSLEDPAGGPYTRATVLEALGELAVGLLVERVGEPAIFRFFEDPGRDWRAWHELFETTFGLTAEAFYEEFETYRAGLMLP